MEGNTDNLPPSDDNILTHVLAAYREDSSLGSGKLLKRILADNPHWVGKVSLKRIKKLRRINKLFCTAPGAPSALTYEPPPNTSLEYEQDQFGEILVGDWLAFHRSFVSRRTLSSKRPNHLLKLLSQIDGESIARKYPATVEDVVLWPDGMKQQISMLAKAKENGKRYGPGIYAVLKNGEHEYVEENIIWVVTCPEVDISLEEHALRMMLETGRWSGIGGNPAGVYLVYKCLMSCLLTMDMVKGAGRQPLVSDRSLAKQLENEYGINVLPFSRSVERNPTGRAGQQLAALLLDAIYI